MKQIIRLTENDLHKIINKTIHRIIRETQNDDIENGEKAYDEYMDDLANINDDEEFQDYMNTMRQEDDMIDAYKDWDNDLWIDQDDHDPTDNELYYCQQLEKKKARLIKSCFFAYSFKNSICLVFDLFFH